jgi:UDP-N-acetylglucosamine 2-epimerase
MAYSLTVHPMRRLILGQMKNSVSKQEIFDAVEYVKTDKTFNPDFDIFMHVYGDTKPTFSEKQFAELASIRVVHPGAKRAYLVHKDYHFGFLRMYEAYREAEEENNFCVFRDMQKALQWINTRRSGNDILTSDDVMLPE